MALDPIFPGHEDLYEPSKVYLFGKPFKGLRYERNDLARSEYNIPLTGKRLDMPPGLTEETLIRDRFGNSADNTKNAIAESIEKTVVVIAKDADGNVCSITEHKGKLKNPLVTIVTEDNEEIEGLLSEAVRTDATDRLSPRLARIYSFSYCGHYYKLPLPLIYLVWGQGQSPDEDGQTNKSGLPSFETLNTGLEGKGWRFASDIKVWKMDKNDQSMVIDLEIGDLEDILLNPIGDLVNEELLSSRSNIASRSNAASRSNLASRSNIASRSNLAARSNLAGAHQS